MVPTRPPLEVAFGILSATGILIPTQALLILMALRRSRRLAPSLMPPPPSPPRRVKETRSPTRNSRQPPSASLPPPAAANAPPAASLPARNNEPSSPPTPSGDLALTVLGNYSAFPESSNLNQTFILLSSVMSAYDPCKTPFENTLAIVLALSSQNQHHHG